MSMLDALFKKAFNASKCKTLLKLTIPRIKLLRNRREIQLKQMRRDIAKLLETGQEATARIRVEHIIREENMMAAQEIMELFCELVSVRLPIIETQRECPLDLKEAISSICFAAPRCSDLPELQQVQMLFAAKYGKEFVAAATELMPDCGVNRQIIELLSIRAPSAEVKLKLLKEIAEEHEIEWDPAGSESEFLKSHEDLLNGPSQFISGSKFPLPKEKHEDSLSSTPAESFHEQSDSDPGIDTLDLPEVPKVSLRPSSNSVSAPETVPSSQVPPNLESDNEIAKSLQTKVDSSYELHSEHDVLPEPSAAFPYTPSNTSVDTREDKQFLPFMSPPSFSSGSFSVKQSEPAQALPRTKIEDDDDFQNVFTTNQAGAPSTSFSVKQSEPEPARVFSRTKSDGNVDFQNVFTATQAGDSSTTFSVKQGEPVPSFSRTKSEANVDLHDVLAAARAAAESAECAAASARSAASLAEVRITELLKNRNSIPLDSSESTPHLDGSYVSSVAETLMTNRQQPFVDTVGVSHSVIPLQEHRSFHGSDSPNPTSLDTPKTDFKAPDFEEQIPEHHPAHQPQRLTSLEDDSYFSYPNLFSRQDSNLRSGVHASVNNSPSERRPE